MSAEAKRPSTLSKKRHRFQRVGERVANLQTELQLHVKTNATEASLSFKEELGLQGELTTIESFQVLYRKLQGLCTTTPQLLHHLKKIVKLLTAELQAEPVADIQSDRMVPLLKLITALARELRREFYPHFAGMLPHIIAIIDTKDPELSTQVFKTLTMLFNILRVQLLKDMDAVHQCYFPLLGHPKPFVREFAAQTLSVLLRRIDDAKDLRKYLTTYLKALARGSGKENLILRDGSAKLFFALLKNVGHGFHSRMNEIFVALLGSFRPKHADEDGDEDRELVCDIASRTSEYMVKHTDEANAHEMLECFAHVIERMVAKGDRHAANDLYISRVVTMLLGLVRYKGAKLITSNENNVKIVEEICATLIKPNWILIETAEPLREVMLRLFEGMWRLVPGDTATVKSQVERFYAATNDGNQEVALYWRREVLALIERTLLHVHVTVDFVRDFVFPNAMKLAVTTLLESEDYAAFAVLLGRLGTYASKNESVADENDYVVIRDGQRFLTLESSNEKKQLKRILEVSNVIVKAALKDSQDMTKLTLAWKMVRAVALVDVSNPERSAFASPLLAEVEKIAAGANAVEWSLLRAELWRVQQIATPMPQEQTSTVTKKKKSAKASAPVNAWSALEGHEQSFAMLSAFLEYLKMQTREKQREMLPADLLEEAEQRLGSNLRSPTRAIRLVTLEILACFDRLQFLPAEDVDAATLEGECDILDHTLGAESLSANVSVDVEREIVRHITRIKILSRSKQTPTIYKKLAVHHLFGLYHVKFATLWPHVAEAIAEVVSLDFPTFWPSVRDEIWFAASRAELPLPSTASEAQEARSIANLERDAFIVAEREFQAVCRLERGELDATDVTDTLTHHSLVWKGMEKFVDAIETKTKFLVPVFLLFLRDQYATIYKDEIDESKLLAIHEILEKAQQLEIGEWLLTKYKPLPSDAVTSKAVRVRTIDYLRLFACFKNMKGSFANGLLHDLFFDLFLMKADDAVSKLALQCMYGFGKKHLGAYKTQLNRIADAATFREELTTFHIAPDAGIILNEHRAALLPVLVRLLYAKAVSKRGRNAGDTVGARRAAILSYLAALPAHELIFFIELVVRAFAVDIHSKKPTEVEAVHNVNEVQQSRVLGFLNLLEDLIAQLGVHLTSFVPVLADVVLAVLTHNYRERDEELAKKHDEEVEDAENTEDVDMDGEEVHTHSHSKMLGMRKQIRTLAFRRLAELVEKYDNRLDFTPWVSRVLSVADDAIMHLPGAVVGANKASALLQFVVAVAGGDRSRQALSKDHLVSVIRTLSSGLADASDASARGISPEILGSVLQFLSAMLDGDEKEDATPDSWQLVPHIPFMLEQFVIRFQSKAARYAQEKYAGSSKRELVFLCRLSQHLSATPELQQSAQKSAFDLFQLLLPFLQRNHRSSVLDMENILQVLTQLVPLLADPKRYLASLAKHLAPGPNGLTDRGVRARLVDVFVAIGSHPNAAGAALVGEFLRNANAFDAKKIEEIDFETRMDALSNVNNREFADFVDEAALLTPVAAQFVQCMHETEYTVRSSALAGITTLVRLSAGAVEGKIEGGDQRRVVLLNVLESLIMPSVRFSVRVPSEDIRRGFVLLLGSLADYAVQFKEMPYVPSDLAFLRRADDVEVDFFYNLTHIQVHRKRRALQRLSSLMKEMAESKKQHEEASATSNDDVVMAEPIDDDDDDEAMEIDAAAQALSVTTEKWFSNSTVNNLLLPLVMHFVYEAQAKSQESLRHEAAICIGASAGLLGWSHYLALLRRLLKSIDGHTDMENSIISSICAVIDHHHFTNEAIKVKGWQEVKNKNKRTEEDSVEAQNAQAFKVQDQMESQVLPMLKKYLFKAVTAKGAQRISSTTSFDDSIVSSKDVVVRVPLALAIVKVLRRLRVSAFYLEFPKLLVSFIKLLKSKQEDVRASARVTLVKIVDEMGTAYLLPIVEELRHTLQEASTHVLAYTMHTILEKVSTIAKPKKPSSLLDQAAQAVEEGEFASDLDACLPSILDIIVEDLFQGVVESQDGAVHKSKMKEAKSTSKSYDALELLTRSITFLPNTSVHEVVAALITKFHQNPENARNIQVLQESLRRVALGVVKNGGVEKSYVFLYAYNIMEASLESIRPMTELEKEKYKKVTNGVTAWQVSEKTEAAAKQLAKRVDPKAAAKVLLQSKMTGYNRHEIDDVEHQQSRTHLDELLSYSAYLLFAFVRSGADKKEAESATLVDPLVPLLMRCACESKNNRAVIHALKCLSVLLNDTTSELPSLDVALSPLVDRIFKILQKAGAATRGNDMVQTCYRTLTIVLRHRPDFRLTEAQLRVVVSFVRADLDETDHQNATYALLKSIIASRLVIPEIYDVVVRVGEILVQSDTQSARANCASIFITFLLEYPLGPKRLTQHLNFLMKNLQYEYESGRRAVLETLTALIKKLPLEVINDKAQLLLLPLVLRLANDESAVCKELAAQAIATLVKRMGNQSLNECLALIAKWWSNGKDKKLLVTAAQVTSLVLDCRPEFLEKHAVAILSSAYSELSKRVDELRDDSDYADEATVVDSWSLVHHLLTTIERFSECLIATYETWLLATGSSFLTTELPALLIEYPHAQVRQAALKIVGSYVRRRDVKTLAFSTGKKIKKASADLVQKSPLFFQSRGALFMWASRVNKLLEKPNVTEATAEEVLVVLAWLVAALQEHEATIPQDMNVEDADAVNAVEAKTEDTEGAEDEAEPEAGSDEDESDKEEQTETDEQAIAAQDEKEKQQSKTPLGWVLTRLSYLARGSSSEVVKSTVFKFFAAFIHEQDAETSRKFVVQLINPLYRSASVLHDKKDESALLMMASSKRHVKADEPPPSALLAQEVLERLEQKIGATAFLDAYTFVQKKLAVFRATRREKRKRDLMNDPQLAAKRKLQKNDQKKRAKQLKKRKFAVLKGTISAATRPSKVLRPGAE